MATHGQPLLQELQRALPTLSPKLGGVARFCIQHATTLHHYRIQDVADACDTMPVSVVRLAQRFGLRGFQELKLAFIDAAPADHGGRAIPAAPQSPEGHAAQRDLDSSAQGLNCLQAMVSRPEFVDLVQALRNAALLRFDWAGEEDRLIALHLQTRLRAAGLRQVDGLPGRGAAWLVQIAVWRDMDLHPGGLVAADFGAHVLRLVRGRLDQPSTLGCTGTTVRLGTDTRRMVNAFAWCEALTTALQTPVGLKARQVVRTEASVARQR